MLAATPTSPPFLHVTDPTGPYRRNWFDIQSWSRTVTPYACCYNPTVSIPTIAAGTPGAISYVSWTPTSNQDDWSFLGQSDATWIRFPYDGLYNIFYNFTFTDTISSVIELETWLDYAATSDTGFSSVSFTGGTNNPIRQDYAVGDRFKSLTAYFPNYVAFANDLIRVGFRVNSAQAIATSTIPMASFSLAMPIPKRISGGGTV